MLHSMHTQGRAIAGVSTTCLAFRNSHQALRWFTYLGSEGEADFLATLYKPTFNGVAIYM